MRVTAGSMCLGLTAFLSTLASLPAVPTQSNAEVLRPSVPVSAAGEELMLDLWSRGFLRQNPYVGAVVARHRERADAWWDAPAIEPPPRASSLGIQQALGPDAIVNDRNAVPNCLCSGRPLSQAEASIAAHGPYVLASWNDTRGRCPGNVSGTGLNVGYSTDYGATFRELGFQYGPNGEVFHGDPIVAMNAKSGAVYICGIHRQLTGQFIGVGISRAHFEGDSLVVDLRAVVSVAATGDFHDKPWMAVDSLSGNVYVTWTNFRVDGVAIELQRLNADLQPLGPRQILRDTPFTEISGVQFSYPNIGPDGVLYVAWGLYFGDGSYNVPPSQWEIVRSDDFGATFGPIAAIPFVWYISAVPAGFQRNFWPGGLAMAVDCSNGPYRGRAYITWSENEYLGDFVADTANVLVEQENNNFFASANAFTPGTTLRGFQTVNDNDLFSFTGTRGQVFILSGLPMGDTLTANMNVRILCHTDTIAVQNYRYLAEFGGVAIILPYDGTYYVQFQSVFGNSGPYGFVTGLDTPTSTDRSADLRDQYIAYSDDGQSWRAARMDDAPVGTDGSWVQVAVDGRGRVHSFWFDWRDDPVCGVITNQYHAASGDGGVTWGANRKMTDQPSFWGLLASCSDNNMGDYTQMTADGDHVYSAFADSRFGDPDIIVDASVFASEGSCPGRSVVRSGKGGTLEFTLTNQGNFETPLAWRLTDDKGWLTGAMPDLSGSQPLAANGGSVVVTATIVPPAKCEGESTFVSFITSDPHIPGMEDTCVTVVRCQTTVSTLLSTAGAEVQNGRVLLRWRGSALARMDGTVSRRVTGSGWTILGTIRSDGEGLFAYEDRDVAPGRYVYRIEVPRMSQPPVVEETAVEVPGSALAVREAARSRDGTLNLTVTLPASRPAVLEVLDVAGRRLVSRQVGSLGSGSHQVRLDERRLAGGIYLLRLSQDGASVSGKAVVTR